MNIAREAHVREVIQKIAVETPRLGEPLDVLRGKPEIFKKIESLFQPGCDKTTAGGGSLRAEELKDRRAVAVLMYASLMAS